MRTQIDQDGDPAAEALGRVYLFLLDAAAKKRGEQDLSPTEEKCPNEQKLPLVGKSKYSDDGM